ncbi:hypothetical protein K9M74_05240 [Candidatus Woesearchaeota archaeon]|nr:hypothetical protein [Candidatus Woesearchaeota archaeon]
MTLAKERIVDVLKQLVPDKDAEEIVFYLQGKQNISEFIIAEELDLEIHRTRNLLYRLLDSNVVSFKRKKDKIKGWYICYWDFNEQAISHLEEKLRLETIAKLRNRLENEQGGFFYMCRHAHVRQNFEDAFEDDFKCPECGELMNQQDNQRTIAFLTQRIEKLEAEQDVFAQERAVFLKAASKKAAQEIKEAQEAGEQKWEKKSAQRAIKQSTKTVAEKAELTKAAKAAARKTPVKKKTTAQNKTAGKNLSTKKATAKKTATTKKVTPKKNSVKKTSQKKTTKKKAPSQRSTSQNKTDVKNSSNEKAASKNKTTKKAATKKTGIVKKIAKRIGNKK